MKNMKKWSAVPIAGTTAIKRATIHHDWWSLPVLQFCSFGEPTEFFLYLSFPGRVEDLGRHNELVEEFDGVRIVANTYRPFPSSVTQRSLEQLLEGVVTIVWYLEQWDDPVCHAYRYWRGAGRGFRMPGLRDKLTARNRQIKALRAEINRLKGQNLGE